MRFSICLFWLVYSAYYCSCYYYFSFRSCISDLAFMSSVFLCLLCFVVLLPYLYKYVLMLIPTQLLYFLYISSSYFCLFCLLFKHEESNPSTTQPWIDAVKGDSPGNHLWRTEWSGSSASRKRFNRRMEKCSEKKTISILRNSVTDFRCFLYYCSSPNK